MLDFHRVGDFGQRFRATGRECDEQQPVADANELHRLPPGQRGPAQQFDSFLGQGGRSGRGKSLRDPDENYKQPQDDDQATDDGADGRSRRGNGWTIKRSLGR